MYIPANQITDSHSLCGSVDWNTLFLKNVFGAIGHSLCGSVDWNVFEKLLAAFVNVTPYVGVWIETSHSTSEEVRTGVTPYVGVWIETSTRHKRYLGRYCHSLCGSVDWNMTYSMPCQQTQSHSLCGSVDWNLKGVNEIYNLLSHSLCGSVDWNKTMYWDRWIGDVTPYVGVWIETR